MVHNFYGSSAPSGENQAFEAEVQLLQRRGHDVVLLTRHSDDIRRGPIGLARGALSTPWNAWVARKITRMVDHFRPDVVHVHNTFPMISPAIFHAVGARSTRILTLHNFRLFCAAGIPMRSGLTCTKCLDQRSVLPALKHACYRNSFAATLPLAISIALHRHLGTWEREVDAFIALTEFQRDKMSLAGLPMEKIKVKPNFFPGMPEPVPWSAREAHVVYVGRLSEEKGLRTLIAAWRAWGSIAPELRLIGDGPLRSELMEAATGLRVSFSGRVESEAARRAIAQAKLLILPSECIEGFPMTLGEAFAHATPVAVSAIGPLPKIVRQGINGIVFGPHDPSALLAGVRRIWENEGALERLGQGARDSFLELYDEQSNYQQLMQIYESAATSKMKVQS